MGNGGDGKKKKPDGNPAQQRKAGDFDLTPAEVGREAGRVRGDPRFTPSEREASQRVAEQEMKKALANKAEQRRRARRF